MRTVIVTMIVFLVMVSNVSAAVVIAGTSFENEFPTGDGKYFHDVNGADHDMDNWGGVIVNSTIDSEIAGDLGFDAYFFAVDHPDYVQTTTDYYYLGVTTYYPYGSGGYPDGIQGYQLQNCDGKIRVTFDTVDVSSYSNVWLMMEVFVSNTTWETQSKGNGMDALSVELQSDAGNVVLVDPNLDLDYSAMEGRWTTLTASVPAGATQTTLVVEFTSNATSKQLFLDNIRFIADADSGPNDYTGWEDFILPDDLRGILGEYPEQSIDQAISTTESYSGSKSLLLVHGDVSSTPTGYVAWINDLQVGDIVTARFYAKSGSPDSNGVRMWGHWTDGDDMKAHRGSAGGNTNFIGENWKELMHSWKVTDANLALMVEARIYDDVNDIGYVDDITVWAPEHASITLPHPVGIYCETLPQFDFNGDCRTDFADFAIFAEGWLSCNRYPVSSCEE